MEIKETGTFVIIEGASLNFCKCVELLPLRLVWYEIKFSEGLMEVEFSPSSTESIKCFDVDEIVDQEKITDDDVEMTFNLYFVKE